MHTAPLSRSPFVEPAAPGRRLSEPDALDLLDRAPLAQLASAAHAERCRRNDPRIATYVRDRNVNYTNICVTGCDFCAFSRQADAPDAYLLPWETIEQKIRELADAGGTQLLMQGGIHPSLRLDFYLGLIRRIREKFPSIDIHSFSPGEILHVARLEKITARDVLAKFQEAGLKSLPGGGAEILVDRVRNAVSPRKISADEWIDVMRAAHGLGMRTTATMMFGHVETRAERIEHLRRLRALQDETGGFTAFIPWTFQNENNRLCELPKTTAVDYLRTLAVSRLYLDNFAHVQASWVTMGPEVCQMALWTGADDAGGTMMEENVVREAGTAFRMNEAELRGVIQGAGFEPKRRDTYYRMLENAD
jgi:cyclic dehypoxanthinyl futalosine synthase